MWPRCRALPNTQLIGRGLFQMRGTVARARVRHRDTLGQFRRRGIRTQHRHRIILRPVAMSRISLRAIST